MKPARSRRSAPRTASSVTIAKPAPPRNTATSPARSGVVSASSPASRSIDWATAASRPRGARMIAPSERVRFKARSRLLDVEQAGIADQRRHAAQHALEGGERLAKGDAVSADHELADR